MRRGAGVPPAVAGATRARTRGQDARTTGGVVGVLWQARVANAERRKAEARSADLRQLSNSLLSELDEAIKQLPGSTGVQKLLVTRVLEHLDRMAKDAQGDRQTQLDLVDAYTRLGNIQGNAYDQNLGDPAGAFVSLEQSSRHCAAARGLQFARTAKPSGRWRWCSSRAARFFGKPTRRRRQFPSCGKP